MQRRTLKAGCSLAGYSDSECRSFWFPEGSTRRSREICASCLIRGCFESGNLSHRKYPTSLRWVTPTFLAKSYSVPPSDLPDLRACQFQSFIQFTKCGKRTGISLSGKKVIKQCGQAFPTARATLNMVGLVEDRNNILGGSAPRRYSQLQNAIHSLAEYVPCNPVHEADQASAIHFP